MRPTLKSCRSSHRANDHQDLYELANCCAIQYQDLPSSVPSAWSITTRTYTRAAMTAEMKATKAPPTPKTDVCREPDSRDRIVRGPIVHVSAASMSRLLDRGISTLRPLAFHRQGKRQSWELSVNSCWPIVTAHSWSTNRDRNRSLSSSSGLSGLNRSGAGEVSDNPSKRDANTVAHQHRRLHRRW